MIRILPALAFILTTLGLSAQESTTNWCKTDQVYQEAYAQNPEKFAEIERAYDQSIVDYGNLPRKKDDGRTFYIPVVFHYFHRPSQSDPSRFFGEPAANAVIERLNADFNNTNSDTADIQPFYAARRGNANIRFVIANIDPNGEPSTGINYISTVKTEAAERTTDDEVKYMSNWPNQNYLNFWIVESIGRGTGVLAYATLPEFVAAQGGVSASDGVIGLLDIYRERITDRFYRHALAHEVGHYLGLRHPFQGDANTPDLFSDGPGCSDLPCKFGGDKICDIAQVDTIHRQCIRNHNTCANDPKIDNITNIMDYRYCPAMFSKEQVIRMRGTLTGHRQYLVSWENLNNVGIDDEVNAQQRHEVDIYPNPFNTVLNLEISVQNDVQACIEIRDLLGRSAYKDCKKKLHAGTNKIQLDAAEANIVSEGIYMVEIRLDNQTIVKKVHFKP